MSVLVKDVTDYLLADIDLPIDTVDTLQFGDSSQSVSKIAICFMPTYEVLEETINLGANFLISHEALFYHHTDTKIFAYDPIVQTKQDLIKESGLNVFRLHDAIHKMEPDMITQSIVQSLEWEEAIIERLPVATIIGGVDLSVESVLKHIKKKLNIDSVRYSGHLDQNCQRIGIFVGYRGGSQQTLPLISKYDLDLVIYGEGPEWETPEYVRDASYVGENRALISIGHMESEVPGMITLKERLKKQFPHTPIHFIDHPTCLKTF
ncbi:Putative GTP cyclohydrolase 1 type 2, NIF3 family [Pelagirhabdus alkalitolerans]|uniref:GTP cyclohydrolase 1 type 2 homolog n=1 Tax=Pelagirhabdus alkalitolerans TaxID=1612202 RepID=A0A1G6JU20_9BACI|nr:Nif3-like dinuclear metal center hexameric protein [Pelagirhabdus alkalitolerans]SDC22214.1 Putative GTP cyclohydrolase 1 type 2, NIF3 family [Pelagirhabdus alkalitolerans]